MARDICPKCSSFTALGEYRCFKCGYITGIATHNYRHLFFAATYDKELSLPDNLLLNPSNFHVDALKWLYESHISNKIIIDQHIGYCPDVHQVFIPAINNDNQVMFYQMRILNYKDDKYKYLTVGSSKNYLIHYEDCPESNQVVIVEDHLSAIRVRKHSNVVALSGTSLSYTHCKELCKRYSAFVFWLDSDQPGIDGMYKNLDRLRKISAQQEVNSMFLYDEVYTPTFRHVVYTQVELDPKEYVDEEIKEVLTEKVRECD